MLHPIVIFVQYNIYASFCCKCGSKEREAPPPRRARAAFPSPSCSGKRPKVERWRGVNGLANNGLISQKKIRQAMLTIVGRWSPCPVLQPPNNSPTPNPSPLERGVNCLASCWRTGHGGHRPTIVSMAKLSKTVAWLSEE